MSIMALLLVLLAVIVVVALIVLLSGASRQTRQIYTDAEQDVKTVSKKYVDNVERTLGR